jgi:hypothetical protein
LKALWIRHFKLRAVDISSIQQCPTLENLDLLGTGVGDDGLKAIADKCRRLNTLYLEYSGVTSAGMVHLKHLPLQALLLQFVGIDQAGLEQIAEIKSLQTLSLVGSDVGNLDLGVLAGQTRLKDLYLHATSFGDHNVSGLLQIPSLEMISLSNTKITERGLQELANHPGLRKLELGGMKLTEKQVRAFLNFTELRSLSVTETGLTKDDIDLLQRALPNCRIEWDGGVIAPMPQAPLPLCRLITDWRWEIFVVIADFLAFVI